MVTIDSGQLPSAKGKTGWDLNQVIGAWQNIAQGRFRYDCKALLQMINETDELELWKIDGFWNNRDDFLKNEVLIDFDLTGQSFDDIAKKLGLGQLVKLTKAERAKGAPELAKTGGDRRSEAAIRAREASEMVSHGGNRRSDQSDNITLKERGTHADYLNARLKRDHPTIYADLCAGAYPSTRKAAIEAGIIKPGIQCQATPESLARAINGRLTIEDRKTLVSLIETEG